MEIIFIILNKFEKASIRKRIFIFSINHEKKINNYLMGLGKLASLSTELSKKNQAVGCKPENLYGSCKVHKAITNVCPPFRPTNSVTGTSSYNFAKLSAPKLSSITFNEFTVKGSFAFAEEIVCQDRKPFMGSLDDDSIFTNIPLEEAINIYTYLLYDNKIL